MGEFLSVLIAVVITGLLVPSVGLIAAIVLGMVAYYVGGFLLGFISTLIVLGAKK